MLYLKFALDFETLANKMIEKICEVWKTPFEAPIVIFPDPKLEQWFRLRWIQKKGALANLNKSTIDRFLFDILVGNNDSQKKLTADMVRNVILAYLTSEDENGKNFEKLAPEVTRYLTNENGKLDDNRLFDFASKMASLFLEYETSRPSGFIENKQGILDCWKDGAMRSFFSEKNSDIKIREEWQQKLYAAIFHRNQNEKSLLSSVFENEAKRTKENKEFLTIPYLFNSLTSTENGKNFYLDKLSKNSDGNPLPVFIFGLAGMGQFYRVILQEYAKNYNVYAYIQNPCMEFWEDAKETKKTISWIVKNGKWESKNEDIKSRLKISENEQIKDNDGELITDLEDIQEKHSEENTLLANWGRAGRDNIKLWCQSTDYDFEFITPNENNFKNTSSNSLLHKVQYSISHRKNLGNTLKDCLEDDSLNVAGAPTKIREIEHLHSNICKLLKNGARIEDILVVSPCLDEYRTAIKMVFDQKTDKNKFHIPFTIIDSPANNSLTENTLQNLFSILKQKSITRPDFFALVRNPIVQAVRQIKKEEVDTWQNWIVETNTFRNRPVENGKNDWSYIIHRLLLAQMSLNDSKIEENIIRPFSDIATSDKDSLCKFIECVEDLEKWIEFGKKDITQLELLSEHLDKWIAIPQSSENLKSETIVYKNIAEGINSLHTQFDAKAENISLKIAEQTLLQAAQGTEYSCGNLFINGITFMKFAPNRIIPAKHLFFIGAGAVSFPGSKQHQTLDLRKSCYPWPGDESPIAKNRYAFLCQLINTSESFHLSYVNLDAKKDAELFPSSVINDLKNFIEENTNEFKWKEISVPLDEKRDFTDLWSAKSLRNKIAYEKLLQQNDKENQEIQTNNENFLENNSTEHVVSAKYPERIAIHSLANYLKNPFLFHVKEILMKGDEENVEKEVFEPICYNHLDASIILKRMLVDEISGNENYLEELENELKRNGTLPDGEFGKNQLKEISAKKEVILEKFKKEDGLLENLKTKWSFEQKIQDLQIPRPDGSFWFLSGKLCWCNHHENSKITHLIDIHSSDKETSFDKYMPPYISALAIIASKEDSTFNNEKQKIDISIFSCNSKEKVKISVEMTPSEAKEKLNEIYSSAYGDENSPPFNKLVPATLLDSDKVKNIFSYIEEVKKLQEWDFFDKKVLFDLYEDAGFSKESFNSADDSEWKMAEKKMKDLIMIPIPKSEKSSNSKKGIK